MCPVNMLATYANCWCLVIGFDRLVNGVNLMHVAQRLGSSLMQKRERRGLIPIAHPFEFCASVVVLIENCRISLVADTCGYTSL